jgi:hypothetical protein
MDSGGVLNQSARASGFEPRMRVCFGGKLCSIAVSHIDTGGDEL